MAAKLDVEDRLDEAREIFAMLSLLTDGLAQSDQGSYTNKEIEPRAWLRISDMCHKGYAHVDAVCAALDGAATLGANAPDAKVKR